MVLGLRTAIYPVPDLAAGKAWYSRVLGREPYFDQPFYVGYAVGGFELGLVPDGSPGPGGVQTYWGVADAAARAPCVFPRTLRSVLPLRRAIRVGYGA